MKFLFRNFRDYELTIFRIFRDFEFLKFSRFRSFRDFQFSKFWSFEIYRKILRPRLNLRPPFFHHVVRRLDLGICSPVRLRAPCVLFEAQRKYLVLVLTKNLFKKIEFFGKKKIFLAKKKKFLLEIEIWIKKWFHNLLFSIKSKFVDKMNFVVKKFK